jgi:hypothetical protein
MTKNTDVSAAVEAAEPTANLNDAWADNIKRPEFRPMPDPRKPDDDVLGIDELNLIVRCKLEPDAYVWPGSQAIN